MSSARYVLYGVEGSYYAAKIRCYLLRKGIPFEERPCDRRAFAEVIVPRVGYPVVPVVITPADETLQDTAAIIDVLEARHPQPPMIPPTPRRRLAAYLLELYADEWLKVPALHYRWHYDYEFAHQMMGANNDPDASAHEQRRVGEKIAAGFKTWPWHLGATAATRAAVEASFLECLALLETHFAMHPFALGTAPSLADCALMGPLYAHLYRDPHSGAIVRERAPHLCAWIARMRAPVTPPSPEHEPAATDDVPPSMLAVMRHLAKDYVPILCTAIPLMQAWLAQNPGQAIPTYAGRHRFTLGHDKAYTANGERSVHSFEQWKLQRVRDVFCANPPAVQADLRAWCARIDADALLDVTIEQRLERQQFKLVRSPQR